MRKLFIKLVILSLLFTSAFLSAAAKYDVGIEFQGEVRARIGEAGENGGTSFISSGSDLDTLDLRLSGSIDNVTAYVQFSGSPLEFDQAQVTVNDLFDGLLTVTFFTLQNEKGKNDSILPDKNLYGATLKFKPIDILSFHVGYGIGNVSIPNVLSVSSETNTAITGLLADSGTKQDGRDLKSDIHDVVIGLDLSLDVIDLGVYSSIWIHDNAPKWIKADVSAADLATDLLASGSISDDNLEENAIALVNAGLSIDVLKYFGAGLLKVDFGIAVAGTYTRDLFRSSEAVINPSTYKTANDLNYVVVAYGGIGNIAESGFGISYYLHFAPDNATKQQTLGDQDADDSFDKMLSVQVVPAYTIGQFTINALLEFELQGKEQNYQRFINGDGGGSLSKDFDGDFTTLEADDLTDRMEFQIEPSVIWKPNDGMSFRLYYEHVLLDLADATNLSDNAKDTKEIGLEVALKITDLITGGFQEIDTETQSN